MKRILITGATGNTGTAVVEALAALDTKAEIIAAVRNIERAQKRFANLPGLSFRSFDFERPDPFKAAFKGIDVLFLLRPPHITDVEEVFRPLLTSAQKHGIKNIVFLSLQGAEKSSVIPHNKIEGLIQELGFNYIFVRPSYFMQNLTTTLLQEITSNQSITLPSGSAKFNWIDVNNIGEAAAQLILDFERYQNKPYEITGTENKSFGEVCALMSEVTGVEISYKSINPISFYFKKRNAGIASGFAVVMTILHFLPRFQSAPEVSDNYQMLTGNQPTTLQEFIRREEEKLTSA